MSFAYKISIPAEREFVISFTQSRNRRGLKAVPCGTPGEVITKLLQVMSIIDHYLRVFK